MGTGWSQDHESSQPQTRENQNKLSENTTKIEKPEPNILKTSESNGNKKAGKEKKLGLEAIHEFGNILGNSDFPIEFYSSDELLNLLRVGILINQNCQKYWVDKNGKNCFIVYARDLSITWAEENQYWSWHKLNDSSDEAKTEIAELRNVCWLEVLGKFDTKNLSLQTLYEVSFIVMLKQQSYGWDVPINIALNLPNGERNEHKVDMSMQPKEQWIEIKAGTFKTLHANQVGEMNFSMYEYNGGKWKSGLLIKGVKIQPKLV